MEWLLFLTHCDIAHKGQISDIWAIEYLQSLNSDSCTESQPLVVTQSTWHTDHLKRGAFFISPYPASPVEGHHDDCFFSLTGFTISSLDSDNSTRKNYILSLTQIHKSCPIATESLCVITSNYEIDTLE